MSAASVLARGRLAAQTLMVDACTITRQTSLSTNTTTGVVTPVVSTLYTGACKIQAPSVSGADVAEAHLALVNVTIHLPITVTDIRETDIITITACAHDTELVGRVFRSSGPDHKSFATARRLTAIEITS